MFSDLPRPAAQKFHFIRRSHLVELYQPVRIEQEKYFFVFYRDVIAWPLQLWVQPFCSSGFSLALTASTRLAAFTPLIVCTIFLLSARPCYVAPFRNIRRRRQRETSFIHVDVAISKRLYRTQLAADAAATVTAPNTEYTNANSRGRWHRVKLSPLRHTGVSVHRWANRATKQASWKDVERSLSPLRDVESLRWHEKKISLVFSYFNALFGDGSCLYFFTRCLFHCLSLPCWRNLPAESCKLELCLRYPNAESRSRLTYLVYRKKTRFFSPYQLSQGRCFDTDEQVGMLEYDTVKQIVI